MDNLAYCNRSQMLSATPKTSNWLKWAHALFWTLFAFLVARTVVQPFMQTLPTHHPTRYIVLLVSADSHSCDFWRRRRRLANMHHASRNKRKARSANELVLCRIMFWTMCLIPMLQARMCRTTNEGHEVIILNEIIYCHEQLLSKSHTTTEQSSEALMRRLGVVCTHQIWSV